MPARQLEIMACVFIFGSDPIFLAVKEQKDVENPTDPCYADRIALYVTRCILIISRHLLLFLFMAARAVSHFCCLTT